MVKIRVFGVKELCTGSQFHSPLRLDLGQALKCFNVDYFLEQS